MDELENLEIPEEMAEFFNARAEGYDDHMREYVFTEATFVQFYRAVCAPIEKTGKPLSILDLGCGTGLEIEFLLQRAPNAQITGIDVSEKMLDLLRKRYRAHMSQITLLVGSYLTASFGEQAFDTILSAMSIHHLLQDTKRMLYRKIHAALKPGGKFIEGDSVTRPDAEKEFLAGYEMQVNCVPVAGEGHYHIDVPFSIDTQRNLILAAGFKNFELVWQLDSSAVWNIAVYAAEA